MIGLKIEGKQTFLDLVIAGREMDATIRTSIKDTAAEYRNRLRQVLSGTGSGKQYGQRKGRVYQRKRVKTVVFGKAASYTAVRPVQRQVIAYRASASGEPPAKRTGNLARAVTAVALGKGYGARIVAEKKIAFYRHMLEFGTKERFQRDHSKDVRVGSTRRGRTKLIKGKGKSVGRILPRPVLPPLQAALNADIERRVLRAIDVFTAYRG